MAESRIETLNRQLQAIKDAYDTWKKSGLNKELLEIYIIHKTKLPKKKVKDMLMAQQKFFDELIKEEVVKRLTK